MSEKREAAMRLFGALSGVDEAYLAACEEDEGTGTPVVGENSGKAAGRRAVRGGSGAGAASGIISFAGRYGRQVAAVLCLAVLGASIFAYQISKSKGGYFTAEQGVTEDSLMQENGMSQSPAAVPEAMDAEPEESEKQMSGNKSDGSTFSGALPGQTETDKYEPGITDFASQNRVTESVKDIKLSDSLSEEMSLEKTAELAVIGSYLPDVWPKQGSISNITRIVGDDAENEKVVIHWFYGGDSSEGFELTIENLGEAKPQEAMGSSVFPAEEFTEECVEACMETEENDTAGADTLRGSFGVLYRTGEGENVLVSFSGCGSVEEVWAMFKSVSAPSVRTPRKAG